LFYACAEDFWRVRFVEDGPGDVLQGLALAVLLIVPAVAVLLCALWGVIFGCLRANRPETIAGLGGTLAARVPSSTLARSTLAGLTFGAAALLVYQYVPELTAGLSGTALRPPIVYASIASIPLQLSELLLGTIVYPLLVGAGMAAVLIVRRELHLGKLVWPLFVVIGTLVATFFAGGPYPSTAVYLALGFSVAILLAVSYRHGVLAGGILWISIYLLEMAVQLVHGSRFIFQLMGFLYLALWFLALAASVGQALWEKRLKTA
jgi:hypothetical protein